jgi:oxygen-independent coproporphyrinogen-3 oxidase
MAASKEPLAGLYAHVPFCLRKCPYCDFYSEEGLSLMPLYLEGLKKEAEKHFGSWPSGFDTLYLGGGSPSALGREELDAMKEILSPFDVSKKAEVTLEANPDDVTEEKAKIWKAWGASRISLGAQSFSPTALSGPLGRTHGPERTKAAAKAILAEGLELSLDLIFGWPGQTLSDFEEDLNEAALSGARHVSAYSLTPAPGTPLHFRLKNGSLPPLPPEDSMADLFVLAGEVLGSFGFKRYEVSNFAKKGAECRHNLKYWRRIPYLGLGPSSHSFDGLRRFANVPSLSKWADALLRGGNHMEFAEGLDPGQARTEWIMLGLRLSEGLPASELKGSEKLRSLIEEGFLVREGGRIAPTEKGLLAADYLARELA